MSGPAEKPERRYNTSAQVRKKYGDISSRGLRRWVEKGAFPPPDLSIANRDYWSDETLAENDRKHAIAAAKRIPASEFAKRSEVAAE
jgi:hypothetical protein